MTHSDLPAAPDEQATATAGRTGAKTVRIADDRDGQRIDNFLLGYLKGAPRSLIYKLLRSGQVRVNGGRVKAERKLEAGDQVRIPPVRLEEAADRGTPAPGLLATMDASIVFEDARLLAINKPAGVASHGGSGIAFGAIETLRAALSGTIASFKIPKYVHFVPELPKTATGKVRKQALRTSAHP